MCRSSSLKTMEAVKETHEPENGGTKVADDRVNGIDHKSYMYMRKRV